MLNTIKFSLRYTLWFRGVLILIYCAAFFAWQMLPLKSHTLSLVVSDWIQVVGELCLVPFCWYGYITFQRRKQSQQSQGKRIDRSQQMVCILLGFAILTQAVGQSINVYYDTFLHQTIPFPSWADAAYLCADPCLFVAILLLPTASLLKATRIRILLDSAVILLVSITFSWYFILGPIVLQVNETPIIRLVSTAYPCSDILQILCLLLLVMRVRSKNMRPVVLLIGCSLLLITICDSISDYRGLQGIYVANPFLTTGWLVAFLFLGLAAQALRRAGQEQNDAEKITLSQERTQPAPFFSLWLALLPYTLVPAVLLLAFFTWQYGGVDSHLSSGVYLGTSILIGVVFVRQMIIIRETLTLSKQKYLLNEALLLAQHDLEVNNQALTNANSRLEALATTDPLTELPNHRALLTTLTNELERTQRYQRSCALLFFDIDHFKALNDGYGHAAGDDALSEFGRLLRKTVRGIDTVGRWGGEEFVAILPETEIDEALVLAERLRETVSKQSFTLGGGTHLTCSIGIAGYPEHVTTLNALIEAADKAMYAAKRFGRNQVRCIDDPAIQLLLVENPEEGSREETALRGIINALVSLVEQRDGALGNHSNTVGNLVWQIAMKLGISVDEAHMMKLGGQLHDIGKVGIPDAILQKPAPLTTDEWQQVKKHPGIGAEIIAYIPALQPLAPAIRAHHECWDGSGYPDQLKGEEIPLAARIIAVANAYQAMLVDRPYQQARNSADAQAELQRCAGTQFDPTIVQVLTNLLHENTISANIEKQPV